MKPPKTNNSKSFEKLVVGELIKGVIDDVQYDMEHKFKGFQGAEDKIAPAIRFKFKLDGYQYPHYSRWMKFNIGEKSNLYQKYLSKLVVGAMPDMDIDLDVLKGMKIKTIWSENGDFQNLDNIYPYGNKLNLADVKVSDHEEEIPEDIEEDSPF